MHPQVSLLRWKVQVSRPPGLVLGFLILICISLIYPQNPNLIIKAPFSKHVVGGRGVGVFRGLGKKNNMGSVSSPVKLTLPGAQSPKYRAYSALHWELGLGGPWGI